MHPFKKYLPECLDAKAIVVAGKVMDAEGNRRVIKTPSLRKGKEVGEPCCKK